MLRKGFEFTLVQIPSGGRHCPLSPLVHIEAVLILVVLIARGKLGLWNQNISVGIWCVGE